MITRVFFSNNGTLTDYSTELNNFYSGTATVPEVTSEDAIYVAQKLPFNHLFFDVSTVNDQAAELTVSYWDGTEWIDCVDVMDETSVSGVPFAQDGFITWIPNKANKWIDEDTNYGGNTITGLTTISVYDSYWIRITWSASLKSGTALSWIGQLFSDDDDLGAEYPDLNRSTVLTQFESGKTSWREQAVTAAKYIVRDLMNKDVIAHPGQILERHDLTLAAVSKVAEIIFRSFGDSYVDDKEAARKEYDYRIANFTPKVDKDLDAREDYDETIVKTGRIMRRSVGI